MDTAPIMSSYLAPFQKKPLTARGEFTFIYGLHTHLSFTTILLLGAALQVLLSLLPLRPIYTLGPALFLLLARLASAILVTYGILPNPYMKNIIHPRVTAQVPDREGNFGAAGSEQIAVLLLGAKSNHPLGFFAPDFNDMGNYLEAMNAELENDPTQESGCLGITNFTREDANGATEILYISYWRSLADVHRFAHGPTHMRGWKWYEKVSARSSHIGIMHEVFEAPARAWESIYVNFQPTMLARTTYLKREGKMVGGSVSEEWVSPIVEARANLRSSNGRRGLNA